jgi:hypothetical protein
MSFKQRKRLDDNVGRKETHMNFIDEWDEFFHRKKRYIKLSDEKFKN